jgi:type IV pilus assembly protein PilY1
MKTLLSKNLYLLICLLCISFIALADDTEVMLSTNIQPPDPKVLFVFDTSGSMNWDVPGSDHGRMSIAKLALLNLVHNPSNSSLDLGLMLFNSNSSDGNHDGGRIVFRLQDMDASSLGTYPDSYTHSAKNSSPSDDIKGVCGWTGATPADTTLTKQICDMFPSGSTPLEEAMTEAYRYFKGDLAVKYGNQTGGRYKDSSAEEADGTYKSPVLEDISFIKQDYNGDGSINITDLQCEQTYIVYLTDGEPTRDTDAHSFVNSLSGVSCNTNLSDGQCLDEMAGFMFENDLDGNAALNDIQKIVTYTLGFTTSQTLLEQTATKGGGKYFTANNADTLNQYFNAIFAEINATSASFTSPGVGSERGDNDAKSLNYVYYSFFEPGDTPNWVGNLKKYRLKIVNDQQIVVDVNNQPVFDPLSGDINANVVSVWTDQQGAVVDKDIVNTGGAGGSIVSHSSRRIFSNTGVNGAFQSFDSANSGITSVLLGAADATERANIINWARGRLNDSGSADLTSTRWVVGDPLHSDPIAINYGKRNGLAAYAGSFQDIRLMIGTNAGFLHMFKDDLGGSGNSCAGTLTNNVCVGFTENDTVSESWAFFPKELSGILKTLKTNASADTHPYGVDGTVGVYLVDNNKDGNICDSNTDCDGVGGNDNDSVTIVVGLRRGGGYYYAIDVTDPDNPVFKWQFSDTDIQQSWSKPQFGKVVYDKVTNTTTGVTTQIVKEVAVFAAGYDVNKDTKDVIGSNDSQGRGVFIVDMADGSIIWSVRGTGTANATTLINSDLLDSMPASPTLVKNNGYIDKIYIPDTGGNVWRIDLFNTSSTKCNAPTACNRSTWNMHKVASLGRHDGTASLQTDRRFFYRIAYAKTRDDKGNYDALILGSGHRNNPLETAADNRIYMLKDKLIQTYKFQTATCVTDPASSSYEPFCKDATGYTVLTNNSLLDTTTLAAGPTDNGWRVSIGTTIGTRKKVMGSATVVEGKIFITSFAPGAQTNNLCTVQSGSKSIFNLDLQTSNAVADTNDSGEISVVDREVTILTTGLPSNIPLHFGDDGQIRGIPKQSFNTDSTVYTKTFYWYKDAQ